ncbi:MAG: single-stranded-DNA-specific exonuclease RecJ [Deltaproteobacteria bacterium]|nr:single-stranded-DNA-specific exonuclease RecJ [Deltaproteobacteria bacterium]
MTRRWKLSPLSPRAQNLARETGLSLIEAQILVKRGVSEGAEVAPFLAPRLSALMDPMLFQDMDRAVEKILRILERGEKIAVYGDYDADGLTATALLANFFSCLDIPVSCHIPHRLKEGYGLHANAMERLCREGVRLIITVDCGISNMREVALAKASGTEVIVTDHHRIPRDFLPLCPVINPHLPDSSLPFQDLAGVGVALFLAVALRSAMRDRGWFRSRPEPDLRHYLDLAAIGTVADMVPLTGQNRILVHSGLRQMECTRWPGIRAIQGAVDGVGAPITSQDLSFRVAPRLNAAGRMGRALTGLRLLTTQDPSLAADIAGELNTLNSHRQSIEQGIFDDIARRLPAREDIGDRMSMVVEGKGWHRGVLGIVASRLVNRYHRPVVVLDVRDGMAEGSGRSIDGFDLYGALSRLTPLLERFGGHYHAAGLALKASNIPALSGALEEMASDSLDPEHLVPILDIDMEVRLADMNLEALRSLESLAPHGTGNPEPLLLARSLRVMEDRVVGDRHLRLKLGDDKRGIEAIGFGLAERYPLRGKAVDVVFTPEIDRWQGSERVQLRIADLQESAAISP